jgi:hypothetical protein
MHHPLHAPADTPDGDQDMAARITLLVLRAIDPASAGLSGDSVVINGAAGGADRAVTVLRGLPKPVQCRGEVSGGLLRVDCGPVEAGKQWMYEAGRREAAELESSLGERAPGSAGRRSRILVCGYDGETLWVSPHALGVFLRDYLIVDGHVRAGRKPAPAEVNAGADWVITFGPSRLRNVHVAMP